MYYLYAITALALVISFILSREKTFRAIRIAAEKFLKILPAFLTMLILVSIVLFLLPDKIVSNYLAGNNKFIGVMFASVLGSITFML